MPACGTTAFEDQRNRNLAFLKAAYLSLLCAGKHEARIEEPRQWFVGKLNQRRFQNIRTRTIPQWHRVAKMQKADISILHCKRQIQQDLQLQIEFEMMTARDYRDLMQRLNLQRYLDCIDHGIKRRPPHNMWTWSQRENNCEKRTQNIMFIRTWGTWCTR